MSGISLQAADAGRHGGADADAAMMLAGISMQPDVAPMAGAGGLAAPTVILREPAVAGMPTAAAQEIRVLTATFQPGDRTVFHSHRSPVTVVVLEGAFTVVFDGQPPIVIEAGQAFVEPPGVTHTGYNRSATSVLRVVIFYVSDPQTPFLDPASACA